MHAPDERYRNLNMIYGQRAYIRMILKLSAAMAGAAEAHGDGGGEEL